jgi:hypothetical protein
MSKFVYTLVSTFVFCAAVLLYLHTPAIAQSAAAPPQPGGELVIPPAPGQAAPPQPGGELVIPPAPGQAPAQGSQLPTYAVEPLQENGGQIDPNALEKHPLQDLSLSAIVVKNDPQNNIALLEVGGIGYSVQKGSKVGSNNGVVREITETDVIIDELGPDGIPSGKTITLSFDN